jgi:hypothetical protein
MPSHKITNFRACSLLSQQVTNIFVHAQPMSSQFSRMLSIGEITAHFITIIQNKLSRTNFIAG